MRNILNQITNNVLLGAKTATDAVSVSLANPDRFANHIREIATPSAFILGAQVALPMVFPSVAGPLYFVRLRRAAFFTTVIATSCAATCTYIEQDV